MKEAIVASKVKSTKRTIPLPSRPKAPPPHHSDPASSSSLKPDIIQIDEKGDVILHVTFETSLETIRQTRKALGPYYQPTSSPSSSQQKRSPLRPTIKIAYRTNLTALKKHSKYFSHLLSNPQFRESKLISETHATILSTTGLPPSAADPSQLPWIPLSDDDQATRSAAGRPEAFEDMLLIIHSKQPTSPAPMAFAHACTLAVLADRFDCAAVVGGYFAQGGGETKRLKWPLTSGRPVEAVEEVLRQKVLVSWLFGQHMRFSHATKEMILRGSRCWSAFREEDLHGEASWWNLQDGLEQELQHRRECILNTIASVQTHFINLYSSKDRQCKLGYDSSIACDSFQLGQMIKFLVSKNLLFLIDFSPSSLDSLADTSTLDIEELLVTLKQFPTYQIDKNHTNCGVRIRIEPILNYIQAMLSANVFITHSLWAKSRDGATWATRREEEEEGTTSSRNKWDDDGANAEGRKFVFTRALANDQRLKYEGAIYANKMARDMFTSDSWDWTPEY